MPATVDLLLTTPKQNGVKKFVFTLGDDVPFVIGRSLKTNFSIDDPNISRRHCQLVYDEKLYVEDLSKNGTYLNDQVVSGRTPMHDGDTLRLGECILQVKQKLPDLIRDKELVGMEFHGYDVTSVVGVGNTGVVYQARQQSINRTVAIKTLSHRHLDNRNLIDRFLSVARLAGLLAHPNMVQVFDSGQLEQYGLYYIVMEFVEGQTLAEMLAKHPVIPLKQAAQYVIQIGAALQFGHRKHIIHRDVNPSNIMITDGGIAKLAGLGLAKSLEADVGQLTLEGSAMGMLNYAAPELLHDASQVDQLVDVFGLAAVFYRMITGQAPLAHKSIKQFFDDIHQGREPAPACDVNLEVPLQVSELVARALRFDVGERIPSMGQFIEELEALIRPRTFDTLRINRARRNIMAMLPDPPEMPGYRFATLFNPCEELGGDFYDFFDIPSGELGLLVGDVAGHGIEAAVIVGMAKTMTRLFARQHDDPAATLRAVNLEMLPDLDNSTFVTILLGFLDPQTKTLRFARGGHNPLILFNAARSEPIQLLAPPGTVLGMVKDQHFLQEEATLQLQSGDLLLIYTDGVVEAMNSEQEFFDMERLQEIISAYQPGDALNPLLTGINDAVRNWTGRDEQEDDITLMAIAVE